MTTEEKYISDVIDSMPRGTPQRESIAAELRSHIAERVQAGQPVEEVLRQLGDPAALADPYLAEVPMESASFWGRAGAKMIDVLLVCGVFVPLVWLVWNSGFFMFVGLLIPFAVLTFWIYAVMAEYLSGQTLGKRVFGVRVVRESGARISLGQAVVRQLPVLLQVFWIDMWFAVFTQKKQRAFELLSKTRVVLGPEVLNPDHAAALAGWASR